MEYLEESREYFKRFRDAHVREYHETMLEYNVGVNTGYQHFDGCAEVNQLMRDIYHNLNDFYCDLSIPEKFATPQALIQSWVNFKALLEQKGTALERIRNGLVAARMKRPGYSDDEDPSECLPEPFKMIEGVRSETLAVLNHVLDMPDVRACVATQTDDVEFPMVVQQVAAICKNFHKFCLQLGHRHDSRTSIAVTDEYDVQDLLHAIFKLHYDDIRAEEYTPSYAGRASRMDFILAKEELVVEVKKTRQTLKGKQVGDELIIDIDRYRAHPKCKKLICFVYDPEHLITNPAGIENDLSREGEGLHVMVIVSPKGA